jgi:hypothetical protein
MEKISSQKNVLSENFLYLQCRKRYDELRNKEAFRIIPAKESRQFYSARNERQRSPLDRLYVDSIYSQRCELFFYSKHRAVESLLGRMKNGLTLLLYVWLI